MRAYQHTLSDFQVPDTGELECRLINSVLSSPDYLGEILRIVRPEFFSVYENQKLWDIIVGMYNAREEINITTVFPRADRKHFTENIISAEATFGMSVLQVANALKDGYIKREAYFSAVKVLQGVESGETAEAVTNRFSTFATGIADKLRDDSLKSAMDITNKFAEKLQEGRIERVSTCFPTLTHMTYGGFGNGNLIILAARPSVGKTTIALQMAQHAAMGGQKVAFFSLEMTSEELVQRLIVGTGKVSQYEVVSHNVDWVNFEEAVNEAISPNLYINDKAKSIDEICTRIVLEAQAGKCQIAFIDYLGLIRYRESRKTLAQQIGDLTVRLKTVAKECNIPIVLLCQLNRQSAMEARAPQLTDLRDSGSIEQDGDLIIMLDRHRNDMGEIVENEIDMWVRKNRNGKCNFDSPIYLRGNQSYSKFYEVTQTIQIQ